MVDAMYVQPNLDFLNFGNNVGIDRAGCLVSNYIQNSFASMKLNLADNQELRCSDI